MLVHFISCIWIFTAEISLSYDIDGNLEENDPENINWIIDKGFEWQSDSQLYLTTFYYIVTTITTVGYGDISAVNSIERVISIFLMISGVLFFSFSTGTLTSIISEYDEVNSKLKH